MARMAMSVRRMALCAAPLALGLALAGVAHAQAMSTNSASFNAGWGRVAGQENQPVNVAMGDVNGNITVINGIITGAQAGSIFAGAGAFASASASGAGDVFVGAGGSASASAIGNNLSVVTQGDNNTVIVTSIQNNSGNVSATTNVNGKP